MMLNWDRTACSCQHTDDYAVNHTGPHVAESPWGRYIVRPAHEGGFQTVFQCGCCHGESLVVDDVSWSDAYAEARLHFADQFQRRMT